MVVDGLKDVAVCVVDGGPGVVGLFCWEVVDWFRGRGHMGE